MSNIDSKLIKPISYFLDIAKKNSHEPGHLFKIGNICFCKKCNAILTYNDYDNMVSNKMGTVVYFSTIKHILVVGGLYNSMCIKE